MKKLLLIIFSLVFLLSNAIANDNNIDEFTNWLLRFPNHENIKRIQKWANNPDNLNKYQIGFVYHYKNIGKNNFNDASWTVVEANCHFLK